MSAEVEALIAGIQALLADPAVPAIATDDEETGWLTDGPSDKLPESVADVANYLAPEALILNNGRPNFAAHKELAEAGYPVACGERDSFGWLTGYIVTPKGKILYG